MRRLLPALLLGGLALPACRKVPLFDVNAGFEIADVAWFAEEETLFVFWEVSAEQGLGEPSVIELTWRTDEGLVDWTPVESFTPVHEHVPVDCGETTLCGSTSVHVPLEPRDVALRLRYHRDGELSLDPRTLFNVIGRGRPHSHRSLTVYGVFDETNTFVQWRGRHVFPTLHNPQVEALGLRRDVLIEEQAYGSASIGSDDNPYAYGAPCVGDFTATGFDALAFDERAAFNDEALPPDASTHSMVCARATVTDATGTFTTTAAARKNPEVRPTFPELRNPVRAARRIHTFLAPCQTVISPEHEEMQRQRLGMEDEPTRCIDDWASEGFVDALAAEWSAAIDAERVYGEDMVLVVGLHREDTGAAEAVQEALSMVVPAERHRSTPRLAGAFVFDSIARNISGTDLNASTLWCPASTTSTGLSLTCAVIPDIPELELGPLSVGFLPILPTRAEYLDFLETYSERQAGSITASEFLAPEFSASAEHFDFGDFGVVTFLNGELFSADADDAFSYCAQEEASFFLFRSEFMQSELFQEQLAALCSQDPENPLCAAGAAGALPLEILPLWHSIARESSYDLGLFWDFPFLLRAEFETFAAGAVSAFSFSVPFGIRGEGEGYYGSFVWQEDSFTVGPMLAHCRRFCDHPVFDRARVYQVRQTFVDDYASTCYRPDYPAPGDSGFPLDP